MFAFGYPQNITSQSDGNLYLHRNENLFVSLEWLKKMALQCYKEIDFRLYPDSNWQQLISSLEKKYLIQRSCFYISNGADGVLSDVLCYFRKQFTDIYTANVTYPIYKILAYRYGFKMRIINNINDVRQDNYKNLYLFDSPNSLTGETINSYIKKLLENPNNFVIWDNVYGEFAKDIIPSPLPDNLLIIRSFSKFYGIASLRSGYAIVNSKISSELNSQKDIFNINSFSLSMASKVLHSKNYFNWNNQMLHCRSLLSQHCKHIGFFLTNSKANFLTISHPNISSKKLVENLQQQKIFVRLIDNPIMERIYFRITIPPMTNYHRLIQSLSETTRKLEGC